MGTTSSFFGGSSTPLPDIIPISTTQTYTFPHSGTVQLHIIGAGGGGKSEYDGKYAGGGGAGGYCRKQLTVAASDTMAVTIGVGGAGGTSRGSGSAGTATTCVYSGVTYTGGGGGNAYSTQGGSGGTASGGDINYTGGAGGGY